MGEMATFGLKTNSFLKEEVFSFNEGDLYPQSPELSALSFPFGVTVVWGMNGVGKSSLLKALCRLNPRLETHETCAYGPNPQQGFYLAPSFDGLESYSFAELLQHVKASFPISLETQEMMLEAFGVRAYQHVPLQALSHGQGKRLLLSLALSLEVPWLCLDEPLGGLDEEGVKVFVEFIKSKFSSNLQNGGSPRPFRARDDCREVIARSAATRQSMGSLKFHSTSPLTATKGSQRLIIAQPEVGALAPLNPHEIEMRAHA